MTKEKISKSHKMHQRYLSPITGLEYPGGSTIAGLLDKGMGMVGSAVKLTKAGFDYKKVWEEKRDAGTVLHGMIESHFKGTKFDTSAFSKNMIDRAENSMLKFYDWKKQHKIDCCHIEYEVINEELKAGGTIDMISYIDDLNTLVDYKSGGLYESAYIQASGYAYMAEIQMSLPIIPIEKILLLHLPQTDDDKFEPRYLTDKEREIYTRIFIKRCGIYWDKQELKGKIDICKKRK